jgi:hypothetical protein
MTNDTVTEGSHWFLDHINQHISDEAERSALEEKTLKAIAGGQTHFFGSIKTLLGKSISQNPNEAIREWELYNVVERPSLMKGHKREVLGNCDLCGSDLSKKIIAFRNTDNGGLMSTGGTCKDHLNEAFMFFDYTPRATEKRKKEIKDEKQEALEELAQDPIKAINNAIHHPKTNVDRELANMLQHLYDKLRPHLDYLENIHIASPDMFSGKEFTPYFITPEKSGNFLGWIGKQGKEKLPDFIWDISKRANKDFNSVSKSEWAALYMYSALHREESKQVFIGSVEDDLRLLESLDPEDPIIKKYGGVNLDEVRDILDNDDAKIRLIDVRRVFDAKPNILEIRKNINGEQTKVYGSNVLDVLSTLEKIFLNDQGLWREDFSTGTAIYSKTLNKDDYKLIKDLLKRGKRGKGTRDENIFASYSIREFSEINGRLEVIKRKLSYQADLLQEKGVEIENAYDVTPALLTGLDDKDFLRGNGYRLRDSFSSEAISVTGKLSIPEPLSLKYIIDKIEKSDVSPTHKLFHRMKNNHFERIKKLQKHGLYHKDDVKKILRMYKTVENYEECFSEEEGEKKKGLLSAIIDNSDLNFLILETKALPDLAFDYVEPDVVTLKQKAADAILKIPIFVREAEDRFKDRISVDKTPEERNVLEMFGKLEELRDSYTLYTTSSSSGRSFSIYTGNILLEHCIERTNGVRFYNPKKIEETYSKIRESYFTYKVALLKAPELLENMKEIIENEELFKSYYPGWVGGHETNQLYDQMISSDESNGNVLISRVLVNKVNNTFDMLSRIRKIEAGVDEEEITRCIAGVTIMAYLNGVDKLSHNSEEDIVYNIRMEGDTFNHKSFVRHQLGMVFDKQSKWHMGSPVKINTLRLYALEINEYNEKNNTDLIMSISQV